MFKKARLQLTAWYLTIIMAISLSFSAIIYHGVTLEFQRRLQAIEKRLELHRHGFQMPAGQVEFFFKDIETAKIKILFILAYTNGVILLASAVAGYFLAGKTLKPIENSLNRQKKFVADASHELKTPLTALQTSIEVTLRNKNLKLAEAKKTLKNSLVDIDRLKRLTNDLLALAQNRQGKNFGKANISINKIIQNSISQLSPQIKIKHIDFKIQTAKSLTIFGHKESLVKLITILLDNAIKYSPDKGKISLNAFAKNRCLFIKVKDNGIGIAKNDLPHIFDRFYRADISRSKLKTDGFGLGLSLAKKIVKQHQGSINVSSRLNSGSTFTVKLPKNF